MGTAVGAATGAFAGAALGARAGAGAEALRAQQLSASWRCVLELVLW
jgi:hypothetical protein